MCLKFLHRLRSAKSSPVFKFFTGYRGRALHLSEDGAVTTPQVAGRCFVIVNEDEGGETGSRGKGETPKE